MSYPISTSIHLTNDPSYTVPLDIQINHIIDGGFRWLDFNFLDHYYSDKSPFVHDGWEKWIALAGETAECRGAHFNQAHAPCPVFNCQHDMELLYEYCRRSFIGCKMLGIPWMVFHHIANPENFGSNLSKFDYDQEFFKRMLELAHKYNVGIAIENLFVGGAVDGEMLMPNEYQIAIIDALNDPLVGACWDTGHGNLRKYLAPNGTAEQIVEATDQYKNITRLGKRLKATHIDDNNSFVDDHIPPFMGNIDWKSVMRALDDIGYEHSFTFEAHCTVARMRANGLDESIMDSAIHMLYLIGEGINKL